jgi:hypothetical protein
MASWHAARNLPVFFNDIESNKLLLEIYSGMPVSRINTLAAYSISHFNTLAAYQVTM